MAREARGWMFRVRYGEFLSRARRRLQRATHHQQLQVTPSLGGAELVYVIDHQPDSVAQPRQVLQQPLGDRPPVQLRGAVNGRTTADPGGVWLSAPSTEPEPLRMTLVPPQRQPRDALRQPRHTDRRPQQDRLPASQRGDTPRWPAPPPRAARTARAGNDSFRTRTSGASGNGVR
jgi:hypothetical protein